MSTDLRVGHPAAVELLERALAYTRGALSTVRPEHLRRPTPCARWDLDALLTHMDDALDAFAEGAAGEVRLGVHAPVATRVATLQVKACALLGAWSDPAAAATARVGDAELDTSRLAQAAALEIAVHGWDVAQATGACTPLPAGLARALMPVATTLVGDGDRGPSFAGAARASYGAGAGATLLAHLGRREHERVAGGPER